MRRTQRTCGMGMAFILAAGVWCSPRLAWGGQAPVVTSVSPSSAPSLGGTVVTISGANFVSGATVDFGGVAGTGVIVNSSTAITVTTPLHPPGTVTVTVTVNGQSGQLSNAFAFSPSQAPAISGIAPATGSTNGGIKVTITGSGFVSPASVNFGTAAAAAVTVVSATQLTALAPSNSAGAVDVRVINPDTQSAVLSNAFTYVAPPSGTASFRFLTTSMPEASTNTFYDVQLQVADATGTVAFSVAAGNLPPGMTLDAPTGYVSGRPAAVNSSGFPVTFSASDGVSTIFLVTSVKVSAAGGGGNAGVAFTILSLPAGQVGNPYSVPVTVSDGTGPFIFGADGLPAGLSLAGASGVISGTPAAAGMFFVTLTVTDTGDPNVNKVSLMLPLSVGPADGTNFQFTTLFLTGGDVATPYEADIQTAHAPGTVNFSATGLPLGLSIVSTNGNAGEILGTPKPGSEGTHLVAITATSGADTLTFNGTIVITSSNANNFYWNYSGLPSALAGVQYGRQPPVVVNTFNPGPGAGVSYSALGLPPGINYNSSTGELSGVTVSPGIYPVTFVATDSTGNQTISLTVNFIVLPPQGGTTSNLPVNFWVSKQSITKGKKTGTDAWQGTYIYNADRTSSGIFVPSKEALSISLGSTAPIQFAPPAGKTYSLGTNRTKFTFKSLRGFTSNGNIALTLDESAQTVTFTAKSASIKDTLPVALTNTLVLGSTSYKAGESFNSKGVFTPALGYQNAAFVVSALKLTAKTPGKDVAQYQMLLAVPGLAYPPPSGDQTIRLQVFNGSTVLIDKTLAASSGNPTLVAYNVGRDSKTGQTVVKFKSLADPTAPNTLAKFTYDSSSGKMLLNLKNLTLSTLLPAASTDGINTGVEFTLGGQVYYTSVTIFAPRSGSYSTKMP